MSLRLLLFSLFLIPLSLLATHNRAGEIIVRSVGCSNLNEQLTVEVTVITYTEIAQTDVDRPELLLDWGDGTLDTISRSNGEGEVLMNGIKLNLYTGTHRYGGFGRYFINFQDENRVVGVRNIPGSGQIPFSVYTSYTLLSGGAGCNNSPVLAQPPLEDACIGSTWTHNPGAFDPDGDSLAFFFVDPISAPRDPIESFIPPNLVEGTAGSLTIDDRTGQITWDAPEVDGEYNLAFAIVSYRNGIPLDTLVRDMQIKVLNCSNDPPDLMIPREEICVTAGELIEFQVGATAPLTDTDQRVRLEATGAPFLLENSPASFIPETGDDFFNDPIAKTFRWQTTCDHISNQEYFVVIRAVDNGFASVNGVSSDGLSTIKVVSIKIVAPAPQDMQADADDESITVTWENPYDCETEGDLQFFGFLVYRRLGSANLMLDTCETGLEGRGYERLTEFETSEMLDDRYVYIDMDVERGRTYCYRTVAVFDRTRETSQGRVTLNLPVESLASEELCVQLSRDIPLLTEVDVTNTGADAGAVDVCWLLPDPVALDTNLNRGPYRYVLSRAVGQTAARGDFEEIATFTGQRFSDPVDTCFTDTGLNTLDNSYTYRIELFVENESDPINPGQPASTVRLGGNPTDRAAVLNWEELVPWGNFAYDVFRRSPDGTILDSITTVTTMSYRDEGLDNGTEYCYVVRSQGSYGIDDTPELLLNRSQEFCLTPFDNVGPCPPELSVESVCDRDIQDCSDTENLFNTLNWTPPVDVCGDPDVSGYRIYFTSDTIGSPELVATLQNPDQTTFDHRPENGITGCYRITAFDTGNNESDFSNEICVTNCPIYSLPNVFTPNGDGQHDFLVPRSNCFTERVSLKFFNRWGQQVFATEDPEINWSGVNQDGEELAAGTYYYVGQIFERRLEGIIGLPDPISGYVELVR